MMETPGIPLTRWFDAVIAAEGSGRAEGQCAGDVRAGPRQQQHHPHSGIAEGPRRRSICWSSPIRIRPPGRRSRCRPAARTACISCRSPRSSRCKGSRVASNRSLQWGEQIVKPIFESKDDLEVMYLIAKKLGFADKMFKNIKVENNLPVAEDILREINRGSWSTGYCGQSPERLKAHMKNQDKFDLVTMRAPKDDPEVGGDYYGLPWPCWGSPEVRHPGTPLLYNTNLAVMDGGGTFRPRFGLEREEKLPDGTTRKVSLLADGSYSKDSEIKDGYPEFTLGVLEEARLGQGPDRGRNGGDQQGQSRPSRMRCRGRLDLSGGIQRVAHEARLRPLRQRQGAHERVRPAGSDPGASRADLHAARRSGRRNIRRCPTPSSSGCRISASRCRRRRSTRASPSSSR